MRKLIIILSMEQEWQLVKFFLEHPDILNVENYLHTRSPLDNLKHYMWEELQEPEHKNIKTYEDDGERITDEDLLLWMEEELREHGVVC